MQIKNQNTKISNVLVIGCGGAGLRAAIEVKLRGLEVNILGKRMKRDAHTVLAAGGINAAFGNVDPEDSWQQHFVDTYLEGYKLGDPSQIEIMAKESPLLVKEIDAWGANLAKLKNGKIDQRYFGAHTFRRTCYSGDFTGSSILNTLLSKADELKIPIFDNQYVSDLLIEDKVCFGAISFNTFTSEIMIHLAQSVILCTGGHTRLWKKSSSRKNENTGDVYHLALKAGCELIDMEMVQFHPSGMVYPEEEAGTLVTEAVRGEGGRLFNVEGERFMQRYDPKRMELSTRDRVAMANYTEISQGRGTRNGGVYLDISHKNKEFIIKKIPSIYRKFIEVQMLDISKEPMEVSPTAHYSMGGILVNADDHSTSIKGLFAAGEVAGGLHGANRLGGNSLAEILIFGRRAGISSANYSRSIIHQKKSREVIIKAEKNIKKFIKLGDELPIELLKNLRGIMWEYCGVVKNEKLLNTGLKKIREIKNKLHNICVRIYDHNCQDLITVMDLESSIITAEATILSALKREESRGAHQRNDYPEINSEKCYNTLIKLDKNNNLIVSKMPKAELRSQQQEMLSKSRIAELNSEKLLE